MRVSLNMSMSLDGKIATERRGPVKISSAFDSRRMAEIRAEHDVVINGAGTFLAYPKPLAVKGKKLIAQRLRRGLSAQPASAVVSSRLQLPRGTAWEISSTTERWVFCGRRASRRELEFFRAQGVIVVQGRGERPSPKEILAAFAKAGKKSILLEGGGEFNAAFLEEGLVQTLHLTVVPVLIGGAAAPTWFEGKGFAKAFPRFRLKECRQVGSELYLTYTQLGSRLSPQPLRKNGSSG